MRILILTLIASGALSCTLNVSDKNPKPASVFGTGSFAPSISNGQLVLSGSGLNNVTSVKIGNNKEVMPHSSTASVLVATLPAMLTLPSMLFVSTANAQETQVNLDRLGTLSVDGTFVVNGTSDLGYERRTNSCSGNVLCQADCTGGKKVVAGGCSTGSSGVPLGINMPFSDTQWGCKPTTNITGLTVEVVAICARMAIN